MSIFDFEDYREFLKAWAETRATGRGAKAGLAKAMGVSASLLSQIFKGDKQMTPEQATEAAEHFGLTELESEHWMTLVELARAGTPKLRARLEKKLRTSREQAKRLARRVRQETVLDEETKGIYYSSWIYTGIRNLTALPEIGDVAEIARRLQAPPALVARVVSFLLETRLCVMAEGKIEPSPASTFADQDSPNMQKHLANWRLQALRTAELVREGDLFFSAPMSLSREAAAEMRARLLALIQEMYKLVGPSPSEQVACLNIDWFNYAEAERRAISAKD